MSTIKKGTISLLMSLILIINLGCEKDDIVSTEEKQNINEHKTTAYACNGITVSTVAGSTKGFNDGIANEAKFDFPEDVAMDSQGNIYVADGYNNRIRKISPKGIVTTLTGGAQGDVDGDLASARFNYPAAIAIDNIGNLYVADAKNHKIKKITTSGQVITVAGSVAGFADGPGSNARFNFPSGLAVDHTGTVIYVADSKNHKIRRIAHSINNGVTTIAGDGPGFADTSDGQALFRFPSAIEVDENQNLFITDASNHSVRKISSIGVVTTIAGNGTAGSANGIGAQARFTSPRGIALDEKGNLFVADTQNNRIRMISPKGQVTTVAGSTSGSIDGCVSQAKFYHPHGLIFNDNTEQMIIADHINHRIRMITSGYLGN